MSDGARGLVLQIISQQEVLNPPRTIADDLVSPEGIVMHPGRKNELLVVEAGSNSLLSVDLITGNKRRTIATDLEFMPGLAELPFGYPNDVTVLDGEIFVNGDGANVIYSITDNEEGGSSSAKCILFPFLVFASSFILA